MKMDLSELYDKLLKRDKANVNAEEYDRSINGVRLLKDLKRAEIKGGHYSMEDVFENLG